MATVKFLHVLFVFVWIGSLLMLTRLMGYVAKETPQVQTRLTDLSRRMYLFIDLPSMILAVGLGLVQLFLKDMDWKAPYLHMKLTFAFLLIVCDLTFGWKVVHRNFGTAVGYKILHGLAGLFFIAVLIAIYIVKVCVC